MAEKIVQSLREASKVKYGARVNVDRELLKQAADAIDELTAKVESLQFFADNISKLPDCNTCLKKKICEFMPKYGEYCRINCPAWLGQLPKEAQDA